MTKARPYMAFKIPMSRTRPTLTPKSSRSSSWRPNNFTNCAPATLKRSVIVAFMEAFRSMPSRVIPATF